MRTSTIIAVAALLLAGCEVKTATTDEPAAAAATGAPVTEAEADRIVGEMHASFTSGDAFKIMDHYAPGAVLFDPTHAEPTGDRAVQTKWAAEFVTMKPSDLVSTPRQVQILGGDAFVVSGIAAFLADVGGNRQRLTARYSQLFQRQPGGSWKIVHEHMSLPPAPAGPGA